MYRRIDDFLADHARETASTIELLRRIPDSAAGQAIGSDGRTLGRLAWHLTCSLGEMSRSAGIGTLEPHDDQSTEVPPMEEIVATYERLAGEFAELLATRWTKETLDETLEMYGKTWSRGGVLTMILMHQAHHRGQMTVLMRQAGLHPPGLFGPTREDWAQWELPPRK